MTKTLVWLGAIALLAAPVAAKPIASRQARIDAGVTTTINTPEGKKLLYGYVLPIEIKPTDKGKVVELVAEAPQPITIELWKGTIARTETNWQRKNTYLGNSGGQPSKNPSMKWVAEPGTVTALFLTTGPVDAKPDSFLISHGREIREMTAEDKAEIQKAYEARQQYLNELNAVRNAQTRKLQNTYDFRATAADGKTISPLDYKGKIVLIDFWAGWCGPCRAEMPVLTAAYNEFHGLGFDIIGISLDRSPDDMFAAVQEMGMTWRQIYDGPGSKTALAQRYEIQSIPSSILLDENGKVIGRDLRGPQVRATVAKAVQAMNAKKQPAVPAE